MGEKQKPEYPIFINLVVMEAGSTVKQLDRDFKAFWELEHLGILPNEQSSEEFLNSYVESITRQEDGRHVAKYPFRSEITDDDDCLAIASRGSTVC